MLSPIKIYRRRGRVNPVYVQNHLTKKILDKFLVPELVNEIFKFILPTHQQIMNQIRRIRKRYKVFRILFQT